jgi:CBS domain-containing protein
MLVKEIMTRNVITIDQNATILEASQLYRDKRIGCLIITENSKIVGIVTERDLIERTICMLRDPEKTRIGDIMSHDIKTVHELDTLDKTLELMEKYSIKKLPVVKNKDIVGIITVTDISRVRPDLSERFIQTWIKPRWR